MAHLSNIDATQIINKVNAWQANTTVHPMTCGNDSRHKILEPVQIGDEVELHCPDCDYIQTNIPNVVLTT